MKPYKILLSALLFAGVLTMAFLGCQKEAQNATPTPKFKTMSRALQSDAPVCIEGLTARLVSKQTASATNAKGYVIWDYAVFFIVNSCGNNRTGKLQGGLVAGAKVIQAKSLTGGVQPTISLNKQNTIITWTNATDGDYLVEFSIALPPGTSPSPITGEWTFTYNGGQYGPTSPVTSDLIF